MLPLAPAMMSSAWHRMENTNCFLGAGADHLDDGLHHGKSAAECKEACLQDPRCDGILLANDPDLRSMCFLRSNVYVERCVVSPLFSLYLPIHSPGVPPPPWPPQSPPAPPAAPRPPFLCYECPTRPQCGLPPKRIWKRHPGLDCLPEQGAGVDVGSYTGGGLGQPDVSRCQTACEAMVEGLIKLQTPFTHYDLYPGWRSTCEAVIVSKRDTAGTSRPMCSLLKDIKLDRCAASDDFDLYVLEPTQSPKPSLQEAVALPISPSYGSTSYPAASYRIWWECHLMENGGTKDFAQLNGYFRDMDELRSSEWHAYLDAVYGASTLTFPLNLGSLFYFHRALLPSSAASALHLELQTAESPKLLHDPAGLRYGDLFIGHYTLGHWMGEDFWRSFRQLNGVCVANDPTSACMPLETMLARGAPDNALVEVSHMCCDLGGFNELWHYLAPGSGIFFDLGKTHVVTSHTSKQIIDTQTGCYHAYGTVDWTPFFSCLRTQGYNSVQITKHMEHSTTVVEIINLNDRHHQTDGCFGQDQSSRYRHGWDASLECSCRPGAGWGHPMNCDGS